ncbi:MAG TPA: redoxin family protein, partial [Steroidobacteraceae bacterium]|nr:redoxin family protein [Steroidobacteraceae bacterium]
MKRFVPLLAAVLAAGSAVAKDPVPGPGDLAPDFVSKSLITHEAVQLSAQRGRLVFLSFFASWCGPCRKEVPILEGVQRRLG